MFFNDEQIIQEVYFGKTNSLQSIEAQLDKFRKKYINRGLGKYTLTMCNSDPDLIKFDRMMEEQFGFGCYQLYVHNSPVMNAYTIPVDMRFNVKNLGRERVFYDSKNGYKFNPEVDYACMEAIYTGIIFNRNFTTSEVMAVLLHETGHNFYSTMSSSNGILSAVYKPLYVFIIIINAFISKNPSELLMFSNSLTSLELQIDKLLRDNEVGKIIAYCLDCPIWLKNVISTIKGIGLKVANYLSFNTLSLISKIISGYQRITNPFSYILLPRKLSDERSADNFAAMYGYGPELASALNKMSDKKHEPSEIDNAFNKIPVIAPLYNLVAFPGVIFASAVDEHPEHIARAKDQIDMLEREANKSGLDPKMRKVILNDCKEIQKQIDYITDSSEGMSDPMFFYKVYNGVLYKATGGKRFKDLFVGDYDRFEEYDDKFR